LHTRFEIPQRLPSLSHTLQVESSCRCSLRIARFRGWCFLLPSFQKSAGAPWSSYRHILKCSDGIGSAKTPRRTTLSPSTSSSTTALPKQWHGRWQREGLLAYCEAGRTCQPPISCAAKTEHCAQSSGANRCGSNWGLNRLSLRVDTAPTCPGELADVLAGLPY